MKTIVYSVAASGHEVLLLSPDGATALNWCVRNDKIIAEAKDVVVQRRDDVVDLTGKAPTKPARKALPAAAAPDDAEDGVPRGLITVKKLAQAYGLTPEGMKYRLKKHGVPTRKLGGHGRPLAVKEKEARAAMDEAQQ
jgi:hypothetical protein